MQWPPVLKAGLCPLSVVSCQQCHPQAGWYQDGRSPCILLGSSSCSLWSHHCSPGGHWVTQYPKFPEAVSGMLIN